MHESLPMFYEEPLETWPFINQTLRNYINVYNLVFYNPT